MSSTVSSIIFHHDWRLIPCGILCIMGMIPQIIVDEYSRTNVESIFAIGVRGLIERRLFLKQLIIRQSCCLSPCREGLQCNHVFRLFRVDHPFGHDHKTGYNEMLMFGVGHHNMWSEHWDNHHSIGISKVLIRKGVLIMYWFKSIQPR